MMPAGSRRGKAAPVRSAASAAEPPEQETGLPWLKSWRRVYAVVLVAFLVWVGLLFWLGRVFQ